MAEYQSAPPLAPALRSTAPRAGPCDYQTLLHGACPLDVSDRPPSLSPVESRRRRREEHRESLQTLVGTPPRPLILPTLREEDWSVSPLIRTGTLTPALVKAGTLRLPPACLRDNRYSRLRDTVPCRTLGGLDQSGAGRFIAQPVPTRDVRTCHNHLSDIEAEAAAPGSPTISDRDSTPSCPEWIRPYLSAFREQSKQEWNVYRPQTGLVAVSSISPSSSSSRGATPFPVIVVQSCNDPPSSRPDSPGSMYSVTEDLSYEDGPSLSSSTGPPQYTPCVVLTSRGERVSSREGNATEDSSFVTGPAGSDMVSPVKFYFPTLPTFGESAYLQVPSASCDSSGRVEEIDEEPRQTQTSSRTQSNAAEEPVGLQRFPTFKAKNTQDLSGDVGSALTSDMPSGTGRGQVITAAVGLGLSSDPKFSSVSASNDSHKVPAKGDPNLEPHSWLNYGDDSIRDSTVRFSEVLGHYGCSILSSDSVYSDTSFVSMQSSQRTSSGGSSDSHFREIIDLYRRRDTDDEVSSLHQALDGWVNAVTRKEAVRLGLGSNLPYGPLRHDYASRHSTV
ncbi:hypothetical protein GSI_10783 [Ganoderma sinense ZZ0214-1]|uniref:Uncharacterized protein n=1 Tax=Ganoderma sinense ZZ0214-1 TaxID=1077348 RepID=A0A2G8S1K4_9APHY|nr:hypothetical protein GSI_10783 [Ganoderma sinense ZZ0214-1]